MNKLIGALIIATIALAATIPVAFAQTGMACDAAGVAKYEFAPTDTVYAVGSGFSLWDGTDIIVTDDLTWTAGDPIPADISNDGINTVPGDGSGNIPVTAIWAPPLDIGDFDVVFDGGDAGYFPDGIYNDPFAMADADFVDDVSPAGFIVRDPGGGGEPSEGEATGGGPIVGGEVMLVNKVQLINQIIALPVRLMMGFIL